MKRSGQLFLWIFRRWRLLERKAQDKCTLIFTTIVSTGKNKLSIKQTYYVVALAILPMASVAQRTYWQQRVNYDMDVRLVDSSRSLDGLAKITYINNSPDTLHYIWFHLWPNAYKNDRTAFSEQLLRNGRTDFYFSDEKDRGYINKLDFRIDGSPVQTEDHPQYIDAIKVMLLTPLAPGDSVQVNTPFHVKLPKEFSRSGYNGRGYAITQWYPKPAVYDAAGWHVMPYLENGEYFAEFGRYRVNIEVPQDYIVAATGLLLDQDELSMLRLGSIKTKPPLKTTHLPGKKPVGTKAKKTTTPFSSSAYKTLHYVQDSIHDFAWFASREFLVNHRSVQLPSGRNVDVFCYYYPESAGIWEKAVEYSAEALKFRSRQLFEYPYSSVSIVQGVKKSSEGMEYPMITYISSSSGGVLLDFLIGHEIGHNWFQGMIASNERDHPWMDEGMNSFIDRRYMQHKYGKPGITPSMLGLKSGVEKKLPEDPELFLMNTILAFHAGQPIASTSEQLITENYGVVPYLQTAKWLEGLEHNLGQAAFNSALNNYVSSWKFRHPSPSDFKVAIEQQANHNVDSFFMALSNTSSFRPGKRSIRPTFGFDLKDYEHVQYINFLPVPGYNKYDKFMLGLAIHNYNLPVSKLQFLFVPMFATGSSKLNFIFHSDFTNRLDRWDEKWMFSIDAQSFSKNISLDSIGRKQYERYLKVAPSITYQFPGKPGGSQQTYLRFKTYFINEKEFAGFGYLPGDSLFSSPFVRNSNSTSRYLNELSFVIAHNRALYPNDWLLQLQQGDGFLRANATGNYFFNYKKYGGLSVRLFASKFSYIGSANKNDPRLARYQPKLLGITGEEDFTYSNYFVGRTASYASASGGISNQGLAAQQVMIRDGGFKMRLDYFDFLQGRSDNWVSSININTTLPPGIFPVNLPLKLFLDLGTASGNWKSSYEGARFMYVGGLQLSLLKSLINVYAPIVYSKDIRDNLKSVPELNSFGKRLTFSFDIQRLQLRRLLMNNFPL